jgi:hypothetical protein
MLKETDAEGSPKLGNKNETLFEEILCGALPDNVIIIEELTGISKDGVNEIVIDAPIPPAVQSFRAMLALLNEPSTIGRNETTLLKAKTQPETSTTDMEMFREGCTVAAFLRVPGNCSMIGSPAMKVPDDNCTLMEWPSKVAEAAAPEIGEENTTVFEDKY